MKCACCGREGNETPCLECQLGLEKKRVKQLQAENKRLKNEIESYKEGS